MHKYILLYTYLVYSRQVHSHSTGVHTAQVHQLQEQFEALICEVKVVSTGLPSKV